MYFFPFLSLSILFIKCLSCARKSVKSFKDIISLNFHDNPVRKLFYYPQHIGEKGSFYLSKFILLETGRTRIQSSSV